MNQNIFHIKAGDRLPSIEIELKDAQGNLLDLTPFEDIRVVIAPCVGGRRIVDLGTVRIKDDLPAKGTILYDWQPNETDVPGEYLLEVILTDETPIIPMGDPLETDPKLMTLPGGGYGRVVITSRL